MPRIPTKFRDRPRRESFLCPVCRDPMNAVLDSRQQREGTEIRRRRECVNGHRFTTYERIAL